MRCVAIKAKYVNVLADFVLSTWFADRFSVAPYLAVVGLPQSGKTTLLKLLSLLCRRSLLISDISSASLYRVCAQISPTILIDEAGTIGNDRAVRHFLRTGSTRDGVSVKGNDVLNAYGPKVISWLEPPDDPALNSRCILIPMFETTRTDLAKPTDPEVQELASTLQGQLLQFRFENFRRLRSGPIPGDEALRPRTRDILYALSAAHSPDSERPQVLLEFFKTGEAIPSEPMDPEQNAVLRALFWFIHTGKEFSSLQTGDLTNAANRLLERARERLHLQPRKVGAVLKSLGFSNRKRMRLGWVVYLDQNDAEKIHQLVELFGIHGMIESALVVSQDECAMCRAVAKRNAILDPPIPREGSKSVRIRL